MINPYEVETIYYERQDPGQLHPIDSSDSALVSHIVYNASKPKGVPKVSIGILCFRRVEQTKRCVESVLRYVGSIDYELILLDNGSEDDGATLEYLQSVPTKRKKVIQVTKPLGRFYGSVFGAQLLFQYADGDYFVYMGNDIIITENALQNILACLESNDDIGIAVPMSSNAWMLQDPGLKFRSYKEMFEVAKRFNQYDPKKWEERLLGSFTVPGFRRETLLVVGFYDYFFSAELGLAKRMHDAGYKIVLMGDTWVCHDHDYTKKNNTHGINDQSAEGMLMKRNWEQMNLKVTMGLKMFEDIMAFEKNLADMLKADISYHTQPKLLGVDVKSGQGLLDLKNKLRTFGIFETKSAAFTTQYKYHVFLGATADEVFCDRIEFIEDHLAGRSFDYIIIGEPINMYKEPISLLEKLLSHLDENGQMLLKVRNTSDIQTMLKMYGKNQSLDPDMPVHISYQSVVQCINLMGMENVFVKRIQYNAPGETWGQLRELVKHMGMSSDVEETVQDILTQEYCIHIIKG